MSLGNGVRDKLATVQGLPPAAARASPPRWNPRPARRSRASARRRARQQIVPLIDQAFVDAARLTGFAAVAFVLLGLGFSVLLPETRTREMMATPLHHPTSPDGYLPAL